MKPIKDFDKISVGNFRDLPNGAYVMKILNVELAINSQGEYLKLGCDIAEGEFANFFMEDYKGQQKEDKKWHCFFFLNIPKDDGSEKDGWTRKKFKRFINAVEDSNPGLTWDWNEQTLKGRFIGGIFNHREYEKTDGTVGRSANFANFCSIQMVVDGTYLPVEDKTLTVSTSTNNGWMSVPDNVEDEELPFA